MLKSDLQKVNSFINRQVKYRTDLELYNTSDLWRVADGEGDCDDYALAKRKLLLSHGWPYEALRLATCYTEEGAGHAVLTVDFENKTYVLDNRYPSVKEWTSLPYKWVARQSGKGWVKIK